MKWSRFFFLLLAMTWRYTKCRFLLRKIHSNLILGSNWVHSVRGRHFYCGPAEHTPISRDHIWNRSKLLVLRSYYISLLCLMHNNNKFFNWMSMEKSLKWNAKRKEFKIGWKKSIRFHLFNPFAPHFVVFLRFFFVCAFLFGSPAAWIGHHFRHSHSIHIRSIRGH